MDELTVSATVRIPFGMTKGDLVRALERVPDEATLSVRVTPGDRPWDTDSTSLTCNWKA